MATAGHLLWCDHYLGEHTVLDRCCDWFAITMSVERLYGMRERSSLGSNSLCWPDKTIFPNTTGSVHHLSSPEKALQQRLPLRRPTRLKIGLSLGATFHSRRRDCVRDRRLPACPCTQIHRLVLSLDGRRTKRPNLNQRSSLLRPRQSLRLPPDA